MPVVEGLLPVIKEAREGLQIGPHTCAFMNVTPRAASLSRLGVWACGWPFIGPIQSFKSSAMMSRTFCLLVESAALTVQAAPRQNVNARTIVRKERHFFRVLTSQSV